MTDSRRPRRNGCLPAAVGRPSRRRRGGLIPRPRAGRGESECRCAGFLLEQYRLGLDRDRLGRRAGGAATRHQRSGASLRAQQYGCAADVPGCQHRQSQPDPICQRRTEEIQRRSAPRQGDVCARKSRCLGDGRSDLSPEPGAAGSSSKRPARSRCMADGSPSAPCLPRRPAFGTPKPSWYGKSIGHYEDGTLVVDTIGQNTKTFVDNYRTPHSEKLHVVERYRLVDDGKFLEAAVTIEIPPPSSSRYR